MKHVWKPTSGPHPFSRCRKCINCGAVQSYSCTGGSVMGWRYGWKPNVGRCKAKKEKATNET